MARFRKDTKIDESIVTYLFVEISHSYNFFVAVIMAAV